MIAPFRGASRWIRYLLCAVPLAAMLPAAATAAVTIQKGPSSNITCTKVACTPTQADASLNYQKLENLLAKGNVTINTGSGALASQVQNIVVATPLTWASANSLTLSAYQSITVTNSVSVAGSGGLTLNTNDGGSGGALSFTPKGSISFLGTTNPLTINGSAYTLVNSFATLAADMNANTNGHYALSASYNAGPDGTYTSTPVLSFTGTVEGLGNAIASLTMDGSTVGLVGQNSGLIENLRLADIVETASRPGHPGTAAVGGLVSYNSGELIGDSVTGTLTVKGCCALDVGGLAGINASGVVSRCSSDLVLEVAANTQAPYVGGLVGSNIVLAGEGADVEYSYSVGRIIISGKGYVFAGGLVGGDGFNVTNSYSTARIVVAPAIIGGAGGLIGSEALGLYADTAPGVSLSYATGSISGALTSNGGAIGVLVSGSTSNLYWDTTSSGNNQGVGYSGGWSYNVTGLTTSQFQSGLPQYFDPTIWAENPKINSGLPYLIANPPS